MNERFYPAKEFKNHYQTIVNYLQFGEIKHTKKKSMCKGRKFLGIKAWEVSNPDYVTEEVWNKMTCKNQSQRLKTITRTIDVFE